MRSSTELYCRNRVSATGSRDRSSKRKYSDTKRSSPVKPAALAELDPPACNDSAARYRPAGHPSVRSVSSESSLGSSCTPAAASSDSASRSSSRRSATPISSVSPRARQRASGSAGSSRLVMRDLRARREEADQRRQDVQTRRIGDGVHIVEHQHQRSLERGQRAPDARDSLRPRGSSRSRQRVEDVGRHGFDAMDRGGDVAQEHQRVVVRAVERDPCERTWVSFGPPRDQRGLAVPGRRHDGHHRRARRAQPRDQVGSSPPCPVGPAAARA